MPDDTTQSRQEPSEGDGKLNSGAASGEGNSPAEQGANATAPSEDKPIFTQAQLNRFLAEDRKAEIVRRDEALKKEREKAERDRLAEEGQFKALHEADQVRISALEAENERLRLDGVRAKVAAEHKLPPELADRLRGSNEAELTEDAKALAKAIPPPRAPGQEDQRGRPTSAQVAERALAEARASGRYAPA